jgi:hypothetical protein
MILSGGCPIVVLVQATEYAGVLREAVLHLKEGQLQLLMKLVEALADADPHVPLGDISRNNLSEL